ncbi:mitochondrial rRNA methyltransferase [Scheffersomyces coipomensis]|uniref:mitochondrial rRNA methyltransferase n=1 Tax=Scheffersomyces coipomensis TaxID=1788519 RepID=UPI00315D5D61
MMICTIRSIPKIEVPSVYTSIRHKCSKSSNRWLERQTRDPHTKQAKTSYYRSRAAYKLIDIDKKYRLFNKNSRNIIDLGFAPGSWTQVAVERMKSIGLESKILGVDLINCSPPQGSHFIQGDILSRKTQEQIRQFYYNQDGNETEDIDNNHIEDKNLPVDLVLSDMMVNTSGIKDNDHFASMDLCDAAIILSLNLLKSNGSLVMKFYTGKEDVLLVKRMEKIFEKVYRMKPDACRDESREMYIIGLKKRKDNVTVQDIFS